MNKILLVGLAVTMLLGATLFATPVLAKTCHFNGKWCGKVRVHSSSNQLLTIANNWSDKKKAPPKSAAIRHLSRGHKSTEYFRDTDAIRAPKGCTLKLKTRNKTTAYRGGRWIKIKDTPVSVTRVATVRC